MTANPAPAHTAGIQQARERYGRFIAACSAEDGFRLTPRAEPTPYALCFALFGLHLLRDRRAIDANRDRWDRALRDNLRAFHAQRRASVADLSLDKPFLQLLTFTLSALSILETLPRDPLPEFILPLLPDDVEAALRRQDVHRGVARSGNQAMFLGILLLHAGRHLGRDTAAQVSRWVQFHLATMNRFGFWGDDRSMSHLQFQNGYHQYELLEYLHADGVPWDAAADAVATLADAEGHFAPYPGGGGCYDYDAVFILTGAEGAARRHASSLRATASSLLSEQNADGGFCESRRIRPRSLDNLARSWRHVLGARGAARSERLRQALTLLRHRHDRMQTHWSRYSREWGESDLWDSWFRMLTLARIECAFEPSHAQRWGFIKFPGIGYHPSLGHAGA
jgi:hypothetical protein